MDQICPVLSQRPHPQGLSAGLLEEDAEVWDSAGRLVAQSRQLARAPAADVETAPGRVVRPRR
ncbi:MAG: hypothetical protein ACRDPR_16485 [Nocardioidaceae bacterium]